MDDWTRVKISCTPEQVELVSAIAMMVDSHIMVEDNSDIEQYNSMYGELIRMNRSRAARIPPFRYSYLRARSRAGYGIPPRAP